MNHSNLSKIKRLDGSLLLVFRELMRQRRTTVAAERLGLTQSAVSHALARLRDIFEEPLFIRRAHGLEPTQRALDLAPRIEELIRMADTTVGSQEPFSPAQTRRNFRIGAGDFMCALIGGPMLRRFEREAPHASFTFRFTLGRAALAALQRDEIDLVLGRLVTPALDGFRIDLLYEEEYCVVAREGHPRVRGAIDLETFAELPQVVVSVATDPAEQLNYDAPKMPEHVHRVVALVPRLVTALTLVEQSNAIAVVSSRVAKRFARAFQLQVLPLPYARDRFSIYAARHEQRSDDPGIEWLLQLVRQCISIDLADGHVEKRSDGR